MDIRKKELVEKIEYARERLNQSIDRKENYETVYQNSIELDQLINQYIVAGF